MILINTALRPDGSGGAVDGRELFREIKTLGGIYRNELRHSLTRTLGVETVDRRVGKERGFEILGVPTPLIQAFSTRRSVIESKVAALEKEAGRQASVKEIQAITKESRPAKETPNREALFREWRETGKAFGFDPKALLREPKKEPEDISRKDAHDICRSATHILSYRRKITERDVFQAVLSSSKGRIRSEDIGRFTKEYTKLYLSRLPPHDDQKETRFTLNRLGLELACEKTSKYQEIRRDINRSLSTIKRWTYRVTSTYRRHKDRAFRVRVVFAYATGRIDRRTYKRLSENRMPRSVLGVHLLYATC